MGLFDKARGDATEQEKAEQPLRPEEMDDRPEGARAATQERGAAAA